MNQVKQYNYKEKSLLKNRFFLYVNGEIIKVIDAWKGDITIIKDIEAEGFIYCPSAKGQKKKDNKTKERHNYMNKVLIVIDMQNDFITGSLGSKDAEAIVPTVKEKIDSYIKEGFPVIFTRDTHGKGYLNSMEGKNLPVEHCIKGTFGWEIPEDIAVENAEYINKFSFGYDSWHHIKTLSDAYVNGEYCIFELVGLCTDICVVSNALILKAIYSEAEIIVDASCCAGTTPEKHNAALETMKSCQIKVIGEKDSE